VETAPLLPWFHLRLGFSLKSDSQLKEMRSAPWLFQKALKNQLAKSRLINTQTSPSRLFHKVWV
jgi:hypothetical protein